MSIFTKIFVVLTMVLAVVLVAMVVPFVMNVDTYKEAYDREYNQRIVAQGNAAEQEAALTARQGAEAQLLSEKQNEIAALRSELNSREATISELRSQMVTLQNANADVRDQLARLSTALDQASQVQGALRDEVVGRREAQLVAETRAIELSDTLRQRSSEADSLERQVRLLREQNEDLRQQHESMVAQLETGRVTRDPADDGEEEGFVPETAIRGQITDVRRLGDQVFIGLSIGSNDGVAEGMRFMIHRGDRYLGNAVVTTVDSRAAMARVTLQRDEITSNAQVMAGTAR